MSTMRELIEQQLTSSGHLAKQHVHPKLMQLFEAGGMASIFGRGEGQYLYDLQGERYLDLLSGGGIHFAGRNNPQIMEAIRDVATMELPNICVVNASVLGGLVAERLLALAGGHLGKAVFANSGSEATDVALRFARYATRRRRYLYLEGAFHGRTWGAISVNGWSEMKQGMDPLLPTCTPIPANDLGVLERELSRRDVAGFILEPVQGMTLEQLTPGYMRAARDLCRKFGTVLIADEIQTGLGRCGAWFLTAEYGVQPDIVTVSKTMSGGQVPVSAALVTDELYSKVYDSFTSGPFYYSTFAEGNLAMAASLATLDVLEELDAPTRAAELGEQFREAVAEVAEEHDVIDRVEGVGLMLGIFFEDSEALPLRIQQALMKAAEPGAFAASLNVELYTKHRMIVQVPGPGLNAIKILPPVCCTEQDVDDFAMALEESLATFRESSPALSLGRAALKSAVGSLRDAIPGIKRRPVGAPSPKGMDGLVEIEHYHGAIEEKCDVIIVGSGPAGGVLARHLAGGGRKTIMIEEGPVARVQDFVPEAGVTLSQYFYEGGMRVMRGMPFLPTLQSRVLGGGSVFNSAICLEPTDAALARWERNNGVEGLTHGGLAHYSKQAWEFMGVRETSSAIMGERDKLFMAGAKELGWNATAIDRNEDRCRGSGMCFTGCPHEGKLSTDRRGVPEFIEAGGRVLSSVRVERLIMEGPVCHGIEGWVVEPFTGRKLHPVRIRSEAVILAAGALASPIIMQRSGIRRSAIGANLGAHPGTVVIGMFDHDVNPWEGPSQGVHCLDFLDEGIKPESIWCTPELMAFRFPGVGRGLKDKVRDFRKMVVWAAWVSGQDSKGHVKLRPGGVTDMAFQVGEGDARRLAEATAKLTELVFAAGGTAAITGISGMPEVCTSAADAMILRREPFRADQFPTASNHIFGGNCMGADPRLHATDSWGAVHGVDGLYVCDTGLFPDSAGVNPMFPAMALAERMGQHLSAMY
jgi:acetylornithine/succinyldiaminopimelate/putrescine aminotransferase/choline dehydrogenase-like flavoprotein